MSLSKASLFFYISERAMPYSEASLSIFRAMRDGSRFLLRGNRSHACQVRYHPVSGQRQDRTALSVIPLERAGLVKFESEPLTPGRYYSVKMTDKGIEWLDGQDIATRNGQVSEFSQINDTSL